MPSRKDLTGERHGRAVAIRPIESRNGHWFWEFQCDCGKRFVGDGSQFSFGNILSCGCLRNEKSTARIVKRNRTHGQSHTRLFRIWCGMKTRCGTHSDSNYPDYGGRGITVCEEWLNDFVAFQRWAIATGYDETAPRGVCTIDRIDNDKGYSPDNCRWVNMKAQRHNRRDGTVGN